MRSASEQRERPGPPGCGCELPLATVFSRPAGTLNKNKAPRVTASDQREREPNNARGSANRGPAADRWRWEIIQDDALHALAELEKRGERFDCVVMDPPYCSGGLLPQQIARAGVSKYSDRKDLGDFEDGMSQLAFFRFMIEIFTRSKRVLKQPGYLFSFIDWRSSPVVSEALERGGVRWLGTLVWNKGNCRPNPGAFLQDCEFVLWGTNGRAKTRNFGGNAVINCSAPLTAERIHPTQKPPFVYSKLYGILDENPRILELFSGSASGGVAAIEMGANYVGVESSPRYVAASKKRLREKEEEMKFLEGRF